MKALIKVGYGCNDHCTFCHTLPVRHIDGSADEVHQKIRRAKELGHQTVVLSGGEPTIRPELMSWAKHVASLDMDFGLVTNGRMLAYSELVDRLVQQRLTYVYLSLHGGTAKVHNLMVRSQAFDQTYGALENLSGKGLDLTINCVVTRQNVDHLKAVVDACLPYRDAVLKLSMVEPKGGGETHFDRLMPRVVDVAEKVAEAIAYGRQKSDGLRLSHGAIPLCLLPEEVSGFDDLKTHRFATMIEVGEPDFYPVDDLNKIQPKETCHGCALAGPCPGLYRGYYEAFGSGELVAIRSGARSNSFNYRLEREHRRDPGSCPLRDGSLGVTPWDRGRDLFVARGDRVAHFRSLTRDFSDVEVATIKHDLGQVYVDVSKEKVAPDDFAADLAPLRRSPICEGCEHAERCTGLFEPVLEDVFSRDDQRVHEILAGLRGRVIDLGCGEAPYATTLHSAIESDTIQYTGVDPNAERLEILRANMPEAAFELGTAERMPSHGQTFDHVLVLRSWNHFADPARVAEQIGRLLRPGGTLLVVDNGAFGLARTRKQAQVAERSPAAHEHYRVDLLEDARAYFNTFETLEEHRLAPGTSNQWLLWLRKPADDLGAASG